MRKGKAGRRSMVFGPVPSRRLGRSLGIDVVPLKTCTYDCVYCQLGPTRRTRLGRRGYCSEEEVLAALEGALGRDDRVDVLTFSGSGEPTLNSHLGRIIRAVKSRFALPVAVLTNGSLLFRPQVRRELEVADIVLPSLDGWTEEMFRRVNRPHPALDLGKILAGLESFRRVFGGALWLEILFVGGLNDDIAEVSRLIPWIQRIQPDRIQINTVARPPSERWVRPVDRWRLEEIRSILGAGAEIIAPFREKAERSSLVDLERRVIEMVLRRPVSPDQLTDALGVRAHEAEEILKRLAHKYGWCEEYHEGTLYVRAPL